MSQNRYETEISVKDLIKTSIEIFKYLLGKWMIILLLSLIGGIYGYVSLLKDKPLYTADLTFYVEDNKGGSSLGSYANLASELGVDLGGGSGGLYQTTNFQEFIKSKLMIQKVLLQKYPKDTSKTLADVYFEMTGMKQKWDQLDRTKNIHFSYQNSDFSLMQDSAFNLMYKSLVNETDLKLMPVKKSSILKISYTSRNEYFAWAFVNRLIQEATDFYIKTKTARSQKQVDILQNRCDSLLSVLNRKYYTSASAQLINLNPASKTAMVSGELNMFDRNITQTMYAEAYKNLEIAKSSLSQNTPNIQIIDGSKLPLTMQKKSKLISSLICAIGLSFFGVVILLLRRYIRGLNL